MEQVEQVVVQIEEAIRLASRDNVAQLRVSLILLDSAAELMLHRGCTWRLATEPDPKWIGAARRRRETPGVEVHPMLRHLEEEMESRTTPLKRRREIQRVFGAKAEYLAQAGALPVGHVRVLKKLHEYRNEVYHRDRVRPATLSSAVRIYLFLACRMLRDMHPHSMMIFGSGEVPEALSRHVSRERRDPVDLLMSGFDLVAEAANHLLELANVGMPGVLGSALSEHLLDRIEALWESLDFCADYLSDLQGEPRWEPEDALRLVQIPEEQFWDHVGRDDVRTAEVTVTKATIDEWRSAASAVREQTGELDAFAAFADVEDAMEPTEGRVKEAVFAIDREVQLRIDIARGK